MKIKRIKKIIMIAAAAISMTKVATIEHQIQYWQTQQRLRE